MSIGDIALEFCGRGGKRLRPRLCKAAFERCGGTGDIGGVCDAIECFHKASLIHDDIQDGDEERYGRPTVWKEHGVPVAIAAGDWLVAHGYRLITESGFAAMPRMIHAAVLSHVRLCEGQGDDLLVGSSQLPTANCHLPTTNYQLPTTNYISICERKTGEAFALAAQLGALAAGADDAPFRRYGLAYGVLFQINDDIADGANPAPLAELKREYEDKTALYRDECAIGVW
jgi:geranylgeranyl pyrophosphate synthase